MNGLSGKVQIFNDKIEIKIDQIITKNGFYRLKNRPKADIEKLAEYSTLLTNSLITVYKDTSGNNIIKAKGQFKGNLIPIKRIISRLRWPDLQYKDLFDDVDEVYGIFGF